MPAAKGANIGLIDSISKVAVPGFFSLVGGGILGLVFPPLGLVATYSGYKFGQSLFDGKSGIAGMAGPDSLHSVLLGLGGWKSMGK